MVTKTKYHINQKVRIAKDAFEGSDDPVDIEARGQIATVIDVIGPTLYNVNVNKMLYTLELDSGELVGAWEDEMTPE